MPASAAAARSRSLLSRAVRASLEARGYLEVETPTLVPFAGQEPHLDVFEARFHPLPPIPQGGVEGQRRLFLQTSPEYAMKRLLGREGFSRCYQLARVFRDGEVSRTHNPEFTLLEFYSTPGDAVSIMRVLEELVAEAAVALRGEPTAPPRDGGLTTLELSPPFERITCSQAFQEYAGFEPLALDAGELRAAALEAGVRVTTHASWDDAFTQVLLERVEPRLGLLRPTFLTEYPASQAALARLKPTDDRVAERFELYAAGLELANGWSELADAAEQRARLAAERDARAKAGRAVFGLDERFLAELPAIGDAGGVAVGLDRLLMLLTGAREISDVLLFPAAQEYAAAERAP